MVASLWATANSAVSSTDTFRMLTDGGILALIGMMGRLMYTFGRARQQIDDHDDRIQRIEAARDAEAMARFNGYRPRDYRDS
jgi:hypothetical protein